MAKRGCLHLAHTPGKCQRDPGTASAAAVYTIEAALHGTGTHPLAKDCRDNKKACMQLRTVDTTSPHSVLVMEEWRVDRSPLLGASIAGGILSQIHDPHRT